MPFDVSQIRKVLDAFENSDCSEVSLTAGEYELTIAADPAYFSPGSTDSATNLPGNSERVAVAPDPVAETPVAEEPIAANDEQTVQVCSPSVGIFWRSPQPGAPPFIAVGDEVEPGSTTCIVEVMKLMNHVKAGATGRVVAVHPANGETVTAGQALFTIEVAA